MLQQVAITVSSGFDKLRRELSNEQTSVNRARQLLLELLMNAKFTLRADKEHAHLALVVELIDVWVEMHKKMSYATKVEVFTQAVHAVRALQETTQKIDSKSAALEVYETILSK